MGLFSNPLKFLFVSAIIIKEITVAFTYINWQTYVNKGFLKNLNE